MKNSIGDKIVYLMSVFMVLLSYNYMNAQTLKPAVITDISPSKDAILEALNGGGLTLSDPIIKAGKVGYFNTYTQKIGSQILIFEEGYKANLGMDRGVLFSTGDAVADINSRNNELAKSIPVNFRINAYNEMEEIETKDVDLQGIYEGATRDVVIFTFKVKLKEHTSALRVAFQFGSEEYPNYVGSQYNDAFGFFVSGPGINGTVNMARNPYNQNTISVNTINGGYVGSAGERDKNNDLNNVRHYINNGHVSQTTSSSKYYVDKNGYHVYYPSTLNNEEYNINNNLYKPVYIEYNGLTKLITYDLTGLQGGKTYDFKIAIADSGDTSYDSGVIIQKIQGTTGADLKIEKTVDNMTPNVGDTVEFTLTATNTGPYLGHNVKIEDILPSGYKFISAVSSKKDADYDPITGLWAFETIEAIHEVATLKIKAKVLPTGDYTNKVKITSDEPDPDPTNNEDEVTPEVQKPAAIDLVKIGKVDDTVDGDYGNGVINYTFKITNIGDVPLKDIRLEDTKLPVGTVYNYTGDTNGNGLLDTDEFWTGTATYHITDADTDAEKVENRATVYGKSPKDVEVSAESSDEQGKKQPTITPVEGGGPLMTNPHIYHKVQ